MILIQTRRSDHGDPRQSRETVRAPGLQASSSGAMAQLLRLSTLRWFGPMSICTDRMKRQPRKSTRSARLRLSLIMVTRIRRRQAPAHPTRYPIAITGYHR